MDSTTAPKQHCKTLHLVRHAQGIHNVGLEKKPKQVLSYELFDAQLSPLGLQQVSELRKRVNASRELKRVELVVTSPMFRTLQTAVGIFGKEGHLDVGSNGHCEIVTPNHPPILAVELCRERMGKYPCDKRSNISKYKPLFPEVDFSLIESDDDKLWNANTRETLDEVADRGMKLMEWLWTRQEKEIAIVSHGIFLQQTLIAFGDKLCERFGNCELRSVFDTNKSVKKGSNSFGKIPRGLDYPNDATKENVLGQETSS